MQACYLNTFQNILQFMVIQKMKALFLLLLYTETTILEVQLVQLLKANQIFFY